MENEWRWNDENEDDVDYGGLIKIDDERNARREDSRRKKKVFFLFLSLRRHFYYVESTNIEG